MNKNIELYYTRQRLIVGGGCVKRGREREREREPYLKLMKNVGDVFERERERERNDPHIKRYNVQYRGSTMRVGERGRGREGERNSERVRERRAGRGREAEESENRQRIKKSRHRSQFWYISMW